ncbi:glycerophosphoryl diester phosphodiesterase family domain-containing protein [Ditylenchus destructor]|uniref:Glycerophosphoryl diester phosphodiesterase family domain-containing protein n=1 Tax=Ditylenchus destructor TaxID=166010 RepID=A0AAD4R0F6_9BILA|nr:glycerophosphoryl diester phosphodiesterase family domain-containing protein [Ditylenchus destructor]
MQPIVPIFVVYLFVSEFVGNINATEADQNTSRSANEDTEDSKESTKPLLGLKKMLQEGEELKEWLSEKESHRTENYNRLEQAEWDRVDFYEKFCDDFFPIDHGKIIVGDFLKLKKFDKISEKKDKIVKKGKDAFKKFMGKIIQSKLNPQGFMYDIAKAKVAMMMQLEVIAEENETTVLKLSKLSDEDFLKTLKTPLLSKITFHGNRYLLNSYLKLLDKLEPTEADTSQNNIGQMLKNCGYKPSQIKLDSKMVFASPAAKSNFNTFKERINYFILLRKQEINTIRQFPKLKALPNGLQYWENLIANNPQRMKTVPIIHHDFEIITDKSESKTLLQVWTGFFEYWMEERDENGKYKTKMVEKFKHGKRHHGLDRVFIKDYTYDTLSKLTYYQPTEDETKSTLFPKLKYMFDKLNAEKKDADFMLEIKFPQGLADDTFETMGYYDINEYIDTVLDVVDAGVKGRETQRNIIFVSFSPDVCLALTRKQRKYPVALLTVAETTDFDPYSDYRVQSSVNVVRFARIMKLHGVSFNSEDLIHLNFKEEEIKEKEKPESIRLTKEKIGKDGKVEDPELIRIVWGEQTDGASAFNYFVKLGMHVIVRDNSIYGPMIKDSKSANTDPASNGTDPQKNGVQPPPNEPKRKRTLTVPTLSGMLGTGRKRNDRQQG